MAKILTLEEIVEGLDPKWRTNPYGKDIKPFVYLSRKYKLPSSADRSKLTRQVYGFGRNLALMLGVHMIRAGYEPQDFGGTCANFVPRYKDQKCPPYLHRCDPWGDWENYQRLGVFRTFEDKVNSDIEDYIRDHDVAPSMVVCHKSYKRYKYSKPGLLEFVEGVWCSPNLIVCL